MNKEAYSFCDVVNERSVLSVAIRDENSFYSIVSKVNKEDFLAQDSMDIFSLLCSLHSIGVAKFDLPMAVKIAKEMGIADSCSYEMLDALHSYDANISNLEHYINKLVEDSTKYKLYISLSTNSASVLENAVEHSKIDSSGLIDNAQSDLLTLSINSKSVQEPTHIADGLDEYIESIMHNKVELMGLSTGYPILDKAIDGLVPSTFTIIAARKKMGKSTLLTNIAANVAIKDGGRVLYLDTEMSFREWRSRVLAIMSGVDERVISHGGFKDDKWVLERVSTAVKYLKRSKLFHYYIPGYTVEKISALYTKYKLKEDINLAIFDYIKEPDSSSIDKNRKEYQVLGDVTTRLKDLAGTLDIPFLGAVQVNRSDDIADSDRVARYADIVAFWNTRDKEDLEKDGFDLSDVGYYGLQIRDSRRGGRTGKHGIGFHFLHSKLTIKEVAPQFQIEQMNTAERIEV